MIGNADVQTNARKQKRIYKKQSEQNRSDCFFDSSTGQTDIMEP